MLNAPFLDLAVAYRQLARDPTRASPAVVEVRCLAEQQHYFMQPTLARVALASVFAFNWTSAGFREVLIQPFWVGSTSFNGGSEYVATNAPVSVDEVFDSTVEATASLAPLVSAVGLSPGP